MKHFRHKNGNGKKYGDADVSQSTYLDRDSYCGEGTYVWQSAIVRSGVVNRAEIDLSQIKNSIIRQAIVNQSTVVNSSFDGKSRIKGSTLYNTSVHGTLTARGARFENCVIQGNPTVLSGAVCQNIIIHSRMRLGEGYWDKPPRYTEIKTDNGSSFGVTEAKDGYAFIGCTAKPMADWIRKRTLWAKVDQWDRETRESLRLTFEKWMDTPYGKPV